MKTLQIVSIVALVSVLAYASYVLYKMYFTGPAPSIQKFTEEEYEQMRYTSDGDDQVQFVEDSQYEVEPGFSYDSANHNMEQFRSEKFPNVTNYAEVPADEDDDEEEEEEEHYVA